LYSMQSWASLAACRSNISWPTLEKPHDLEP